MHLLMLTYYVIKLENYRTCYPLSTIKVYDVT